MQIDSQPIIETKRLTLVCCDLKTLDAIFLGDAALADYLKINIPEKWTEFGEPAFRWTYDKILKQGEDRKWLSYLPVLKGENMLVGSCGFKGGPKDGMIEIGYEVAQAYRCNGLATEIATALIKFAFADDAIKLVQAHTLAQENESGTVLKKCGMNKTGEFEDPEDGKVWRWEIKK